VDLEITPAPDEAERAAIEAAVAALLAGNEVGPRRWWEAGVREATEDEDPDEGLARRATPE